MRADALGDILPGAFLFPSSLVPNSKVQGRFVERDWWGQSGSWHDAAEKRLSYRVPISWDAIVAKLRKG